MEILLYTAFTDTPDGGNPAGVVLDAGPLTPARMQAIAADLGYAESAFLTDRSPGHASVRYFAPESEIPFCGHATIATGVALAEREGPGTLILATPAGQLELTTERIGDGLVASLVTVEPWVGEIDDAVRADLLRHLRLDEADLSTGLPVMLAFAGNVHPIVPVQSSAVLHALDYDYDGLKTFMAEQGWGATIAVVHRLAPEVFEARNPFPPGGVREDPATGSAAAALGAYLRDRGELTSPAVLTVHQGSDVGRPSVITVAIPEAGGVTVSGRAVQIGDSWREDPSAPG
ncbi:PhzF family phenazine biosynthesis protein [Arthrobacter echini]|uniref:PhzF family phenazine biosynthesis protein n=1 Tax=Arthrobacter echini TaxID=1529066 RepID=A0A4S5E287_9MICC|nr:PhzF family phenazine biosynthesis protein [Arthrobacter echini]THJ65486.1 PhzF family phenazine biosynthesis protein [Arthrobacter echini]